MSDNNNWVVSGTLYGIINFVGTSTGFINPALVAHFTKDSNTMNEWMYIFIIGAVVYIGAALVFSIFGSAEIQWWNSADGSSGKKKPTEQNGEAAVTQNEAGPGRA